MRSFVPLLLLAALPLVAVPAGAAEVGRPGCVTVSTAADCDVAVSVFGPASGAFLAASVFGDASTWMDYCLEWVCPSVAASGFGDAHAACSASSVCLAAAGLGHASHEGYGASVGGCDVLYWFCYPVREAAPLLP